MGVSVDPCAKSGTLCTDAVFDALCQALGFDRAWMDDVSVTNATRAEAVRSLTGEVSRAGSLPQGPWHARHGTVHSA